MFGVFFLGGLLGFFLGFGELHDGGWWVVGFGGLVEKRTNRMEWIVPRMY